MPEWITLIWLRIKALVHRQQLDRDLQDELAFHLAEREEKLAEQGMSPRESPGDSWAASSTD